MKNLKASQPPSLPSLPPASARRWLTGRVRRRGGCRPDITQEELRVGFARYEFSALRLAFGLAGELVSYSTTAHALA